MNHPVTENRILGVLAHISYFFLPLILPLVLLLLKKDDPFVRHHARQALVFHLLFLVLMTIAGFLCVILIGFLLIPIIYLWGLIYTVVAIIRTLDNEFYRYPVSGRWIE